MPTTTRGGCPWASRRTHGRIGDVDAGFKNAALVLDESFVTPDVSHQCLEPRTAMAYWQNGKLYLHTGTQSTFQTVPAIARWMNMNADKIVFISEYTGGGFGSKITGAVITDHSGDAFEETERAGDDAHQPRRRALHRARAAQRSGAGEGRIRQGRADYRDRYVTR